MSIVALGDRGLTAPVVTQPSVAVTTTSGTLTSGQEYVLKRPSTGPLRMPFVYFHGGFSTEQAEMVDDARIAAMVNAVAAAGFPVLGGRMGGSLWGSNAARILIDECYAFLTTLGADLTYGKGALATSMGAANLFSWASVHQGELGCVAGFAPLSSTQNAYTGPLGPALIKPSVDTAYGSAAAWTASQPTHDPTPLAEAGVFDGLRYRAWYGTGDLTVPQATVLHVVDQIGETAALHGLNGLDHNFVFDGVVPAQVVRYVASSYPPFVSDRHALTA